MEYVGSKRLMNITAKGDSCFIRYSEYADGTDFTETWRSGQYYMGVATAQNAPTDKSEYEWVKIINEVDASLVEQIEKNASNISRNDKRITNIELGITPDPFVTDTTGIVPVNALPYAEVVKVGGMTYRDTETNTLKDAKPMSIESRGANLLKAHENREVTIGETVTLKTVENSARFTFDGTVTSGKSGIIFPNLTLPKGLYVASVYGLLSGTTIYMQSKSGTVVVSGVTNSVPKSFEIATDDNPYRLCVSFGSSSNGTVYSNKECGVQIERVNSLSDTATAFAEYKGTIDTLTIPEAVQALDGYGLGVDADYCNYIDFEKKQYIQSAKTYVVTGAENMSLSSKTADTQVFNEFMIVCSEKGNLSPTTGDEIHLTANHYTPATRYNVYSRTRENIICIVADTGSKTNRIRVSVSAESVDEFRAQLVEWYNAGNPLTVVYKLADPIITDISDLLSDDNFIEVEGGGTIVAVNENNLDAPTEITYMTKGVTE